MSNIIILMVRVQHPKDYIDLLLALEIPQTLLDEQLDPNMGAIWEEIRRTAVEFLQNLPNSVLRKIKAFRSTPSMLTTILYLSGRPYGLTKEICTQVVKKNLNVDQISHLAYPLKLIKEWASDADVLLPEENTVSIVKGHLRVINTVHGLLNEQELAELVTKFEGLSLPFDHQSFGKSAIYMLEREYIRYCQKLKPLGFTPTRRFKKPAGEKISSRYKTLIRRYLYEPPDMGTLITRQLARLKDALVFDSRVEDSRGTARIIKTGKVKEFMDMFANYLQDHPDLLAEFLKISLPEEPRQALEYFQNYLQSSSPKWAKELEQLIENLRTQNPDNVTTLRVRKEIKLTLENAIKQVSNLEEDLPKIISNLHEEILQWRETLGMAASENLDELIAAKLHALEDYFKSRNLPGKLVPSRETPEGTLLRFSILRSAPDKFVGVILPTHRHLDLTNLSKITGVGGWEEASELDLQVHLQLQEDIATPFFLFSEIPIYVDVTSLVPMETFLPVTKSTYLKFPPKILITEGGNPCAISLGPET